MEYDNDRLIKPASRIEILYWGALILINPVITAISFFRTDPRIWWVLLLVNLFLFAIYFVASRILLATLFAGRSTRFFIEVCLITLVVVHLILYGIYSIVLNFQLSPLERSYFTYSNWTILRETIWFIINSILVVAIVHIKHSHDQAEELRNMHKENTFFKLRYLHAQLNPHFLFNTLNSIYALSLQKSEKTSEVVVKLADIMRYLIYECNEEKIPLRKEIEFIQNYIEIEKIRHKADIRFTVEGDTDHIMIEPFLFISFVENGFKHALDNSFTEPFIYINLKTSKNEVVLNVINSSNTDLELQAKSIQGKGISNSRSLLELLYPDSYALDIIQTEREENRKSNLRMRNARERLEILYPDSYTLDVILNKNAFTVSLILKSRAA